MKSASWRSRTRALAEARRAPSCASSRSSSAKRLRFGEPERADVGRLVCVRVLAGGLAERRGRRLRRRARRRRPGTRGRSLARTRRARSSSVGVEARRRSARRAATDARISAPVLWMMHELELGHASASCRRASRSIAWPPAMPREPAACGEQLHASQLRRRRRPRAVLGEQLEREALQRVADQQRRRLVELDVARRLAAAQHVVVHARQVVVHQRIGMDQLDRGGRPRRRRRGPRRRARPPRTRAAAARACRRRAPRSAWPRASARAARRRRAAARARARPRSRAAAPPTQTANGEVRRRIVARRRARTPCSTPPSRISTCCCASFSRDWQKREQLGAALVRGERSRAAAAAAFHATRRWLRARPGRTRNLCGRCRRSLTWRGEAAMRRGLRSARRYLTSMAGKPSYDTQLALTTRPSQRCLCDRGRLSKAGPGQPWRSCSGGLTPQASRVVGLGWLLATEATKG